MKNKVGLIVLGCILGAIPVQARMVISIHNQTDFDNLPNSLMTAIKGDDNDIYVTLAPEQYEWKDQHIGIVDMFAPLKNIHIIGNGSVLVPSGKEYRNNDVYDGAFSVENSWMCGEKDIEIWSRARYADGVIEIINAKTKECRLKSEEPYPVKTDCSNAYILVTQWYVSGVYKVNKIEKNYIYFTVDDLVADSYKGGYSINNDYNYKRKKPRYKICNLATGNECIRIEHGSVCLPSGIDRVREGYANTFLLINNCQFRSFIVEGMRFQGSGNKKNAAVFSIRNTSSDLFSIKNCEFYGFRSTVVGIRASSNVHIEDNKFSSCYLYGIQSNNTCRGTVVRNNEFFEMGKRMLNSCCVSCRGTDFLITSNSFLNYGYCAIAVGEWYKGSKKFPCTGVVENNTLVYTLEYIENVANIGLMDSGAIYLSTKMDGVVIRNNRINGYSGMGSNRGVFCDDGAYNFELSGNIITGVANSYCIDSRRCMNVEERNTPGTGVERANVNIVIRDNIVDGSIRFEGHEDTDNGCVWGDNYLLLEKGATTPKNVIKNVRESSIVIPLVYTGEKKGRIGISKNSWKAIKGVPRWKSIRAFFVRKNK